MRFHHLGYAVSDIGRYLEDFVKPLLSPLRVTEPVADPIQRVTVCFVHLPGNAVIELVEPLGEASPLRSIIGSARGGLYHVCYEVDDLNVELTRFRSRGCLALGKPVPAAAFGGRRIVFLLTPQRDLIELLESTAREEGAAR